GGPGPQGACVLHLTRILRAVPRTYRGRFVIVYHRFSLSPIRREAPMQPESSRIANPSAPMLVVLPSFTRYACGAPINDDEPRILGLSLSQRTVLAAHRAGYSQVFFLARRREARPDAMIPDWRRLADALASSAAPLVIAPATILSETDWLRGLTVMRIEPAAWAAIPNRIAMLNAT